MDTADILTTSLKKSIEGLTRTNHYDAVNRALSDANISVSTDGHVTIQLMEKDSDEPGIADAARLISAPIFLALKRAGISPNEAEYYRHKLSRMSGHSERFINFRLSPEQTRLFAHELDTVTEQIAASKDVKLQIDRGVRYSREEASKIDGVQAYVLLAEHDGKLGARVSLSGMPREKLQTTLAMAMGRHRAPEGTYTAMITEDDNGKVLKVSLDPRDSADNAVLGAFKTLAKAAQEYRAGGRA